MKFEIELPVSVLKTALSGLNKVMGRSHLPVLRCVCLARDDTGAVTIRATDLDSAATYRLPGLYEGAFGMVIIPADAITKAVKTNKQKIGFSLEPKNQLIVRSFVSSVAFEEPVETVPLEEWPVLPAVDGPWVSAAKTFKAAFVQAQECASTDGNRYVLNGVCLDLTGDGHYVVATDGRHLYSANSFCFDLKHSIIVPTRKFFGWTGFIEDGEWSYRVRLAENAADGGWIEFQSQHWTFTTKLIAGDYPNWKQVIPTSDAPLTTVYLTPKNMAELQEAVPRLPVSDQLNRSVSLCVGNQGFSLKSRASLQLPWTEFEVAGAIVEGSNQSITLNRDLVAKAIRMQLSTIEMRDPCAPVIFRAEGRSMVIASQRATADAPGVPTNEPEPVEDPTITAAEPTRALNGEASTPSEAPLQPRTETERNTEMITNTSTVERGITPRSAARTSNDAAVSRESALKETAIRLESLRQGIKDLMTDVNSAMSLVKTAEKDQKNSEKEIESVRSTLRSLQKVQL